MRHILALLLLVGAGCSDPLDPASDPGATPNLDGGADGVDSSARDVADPSGDGDGGATDAVAEGTGPPTDAGADGATDGPRDDAPEPEPAPEWDPAPQPRDCAVDAQAPLLEQALEAAGLTLDEFAFTMDDYAWSGYFAAGVLDDPFLLSWFRPTQAAPARATCFAADKAAALDEITVGAHPVAGAIRHAAGLVERWSDGPPRDPAPRSGGMREAILAGCDALGEPCMVEDPIALPEALQEALTPVFWAMVDGVVAREAMVATAAEGTAGDYLAAGNPGVLVAGSSVDVTRPAVRDYLLGVEGRPGVNLAAARIAYAIEEVDWAPWRGQTGISLDLWTSLGWIRVRDGADDVYPDSVSRVWFFLDLGGDDLHHDPVGANNHAKLGVSIAIDLDGADTYAYAEEASPFDGEGLLPSDSAGRYAGDDSYGPITLSTRGRQGSAANGIAMLFDLGGANDTYRSLAMSQGYAHLGVGVLYDDGGDDTYASELASQGAGAYGIGLLIDAGGNDRYEAMNNAMGFGYVAGAGILHDADGDDVYFSDHGNPDTGGHPLYFSPQMPGQGNSSFTQGAGFGMRWDSRETFWSGGVGILRDRRGDDRYTAGVFGQGTGYWQGTGILSDGDGADQYDAFYYVQGGAAHYATAMLLDGGEGDDRINQGIATRSMEVGAGHDYSLGVHVNEAGNDIYSFGGLALGASNCNGIGLFVDNGGDDTYRTGSDYNTGLGNVSGECLDARPQAVSIGIMIDAGGTDTYEYPESQFPLPADDTVFGHVTHDLPSEHGGAVDGEGESGVHAP